MATRIEPPKLFCNHVSRLRIMGRVRDDGYDVDVGIRVGRDCGMG